VSLRRNLVAAAVLALSLAGWWRGLSLGSQAAAHGGLCRGLPPAAPAVAALPPRAVLRLVVDPSDPRAAARFVCAQLEVAPRVLLAPPAFERRSRGAVGWTLVESDGRYQAVAGDRYAPAPELAR
jgi:hypothetical protein